MKIKKVSDPAAARNIAESAINGHGRTVFEAVKKKPLERAAKHVRRLWTKGPLFDGAKAYANAYVKATGLAEDHPDFDRNVTLQTQHLMNTAFAELANQYIAHADQQMKVLGETAFRNAHEHKVHIRAAQMMMDAKGEIENTARAHAEVYAAARNLDQGARDYERRLGQYRRRFRKIAHEEINRLTREETKK